MLTDADNQLPGPCLLQIDLAQQSIGRRAVRTSLRGKKLHDYGRTGSFVARGLACGGVRQKADGGKKSEQTSMERSCTEPFPGGARFSSDAVPPKWLQSCTQHAL